MSPTRYWADMTWTDFESADMSGVIAVLPVAAVEQHGPHLPLGVDAVINEGYVRRAAERLPADLPALFLPTQVVGVSSEHAGYPGTLTLSVESAIRRLDGDRRQRRAHRLPQARRHEFARRQRRGDRRDDAPFAQALAHVGGPCLAGGGSAILTPCSRRARRRTASTAATSKPRSMLAFRPDLVRTGEVRDFPSAAEAIERDFALLRAKPPLGFAWAASDLNPAGAVGEAGPGDRRQGRGGSRLRRRALRRLPARRPRLRSRPAGGRPPGG